jgi:hypothetical protein
MFCGLFCFNCHLTLSLHGIGLRFSTRQRYRGIYPLHNSTNILQEQGITKRSAALLEMT